MNDVKITIEVKSIEVKSIEAKRIVLQLQQHQYGTIVFAFYYRHKLISHQYI